MVFFVVFGCLAFLPVAALLLLVVLLLVLLLLLFLLLLLPACDFVFVFGCFAFLPALPWPSAASIAASSPRRASSLGSAISRLDY